MTWRKGFQHATKFNQTSEFETTEQKSWNLSRCLSVKNCRRFSHKRLQWSNFMKDTFQIQTNWEKHINQASLHMICVLQNWMASFHSSFWMIPPNRFACIILQYVSIYLEIPEVCWKFGRGVSWPEIGNLFDSRDFSTLARVSGDRHHQVKGSPWDDQDGELAL